jgi:hypothetical protein
MIPAAILRVLVEADGVAKAHREIGGLDKQLGRAEKSGSRTSSALKKMGGVVGGIVAFDTLRRGVGAAVSEFEEARKVGAQTQAVIKSTGGAANVSAKDVAKLAGAISKKVGIDDEAIQSGANLLLTFKNIRNETGRGNKIFDQATQTITDMSVALGQDMKSSSIQLGKALNDPIKGITALSRVGVTFTEQQKEQITKMVESGNVLGAQKEILKELKSEFGGSAAAAATSLDHLKVSAGNLAEAAGSVMVPAFDKGARFLSKLVDQMIEGKGVGGALISTFRTTGGAIGDVVGMVKSAVKWFGKHETVALALGAAIAVFALAYTASLLPALYATTAALWLQVSAWVALKVAFLASPIGLIVIGLAALAAAVVVAYRESETFRKIVDKAWDVIKAVAKWLMSAGVKAFTVLRDAVKAAWTVIRTVTKAVWENGLQKVVTTVLSVLKTLIGTYFNGYKTVITTAWHTARDVTKTVWNGLKDFLGGIWGGIKTAAGTVWGGIKKAILDPIREARDLLKGTIWPAIKDTAKTAWEGLKSALDKGKDGILNMLTWPFRQAVKQVAKFAKLILNVVDKIPGVDTGGAVQSIDKFVQGLAKGGTFQAFARGGAFARTGGLVNSPITLMGEEAPKHPEFVIPTNPAYRTRARGLLAQAAGAIGFAKGGVMSQSAIEGLARSVYMSNPHLMSAIAMAESGGDPNIVGPPDGRGLWQIEWPVWGRTMASKGLTNAFNPLQNALMARHVLGAQGLGAWVAYTNGSYRNFMDGGQTPVIGNLVKALNPFDLIGKLPGVGDLPGWIQGLGKNVLGQVKDFITGALSFDAVGGKAGPGAGGLVTRAIQLAMAMGHPHPSDGQLTGGEHATGSLHYSGRAVDFGDAGQSAAKMLRLFSALYQEFGPKLNELFYDRSPWHVNDYQKVAGQFGGHLDHIHAGFAMGGRYGGLPYVGKYHGGGVAPREGLAHVSKGERMTPAGAATVLHAEIDLGEGIRQRVRLEFDAQGRQMRGAWNAGVAA